MTGEPDRPRPPHGDSPTHRADRAHESQGGEDAVLVALQDLVDAAEQMAQATTLVTTRAAQIRTCREQGLSYRAVVSGNDTPLIAGLLTDSIARFEAAGTRFRRAEAHALHQEGMTLEQIAGLFGLTRQRISALLRHRSPKPSTARPPPQAASSDDGVP